MQHLKEEFVPIIIELTKVISMLSRFEEEKADAASQGHHSQIERLLKEEQAAMLKIRGLEQKRLRFQKELGWENFSFRQILDTAGEEQTTLLSPLFTELEQQIKDLLDVRDSAQRIIKLRLREFASALSQQDGYSYDDSGEPELRIPEHFHDTYV